MTQDLVQVLLRRLPHSWLSFGFCLFLFGTCGGEDQGLQNVRQGNNTHDTICFIYYHQPMDLGPHYPVHDGLQDLQLTALDNAFEILRPVLKGLGHRDV